MSTSSHLESNCMGRKNRVRVPWGANNIGRDFGV